MDKPTFSKRVSAGTRIYYFDAHKDPKGHNYISITEVPVARSPGQKKRQRVFIHQEDFEPFIVALAETITKVDNPEF